ncbi:Protein spaetzle [Chionoecetes opilio]|uniref:Protein spaetzle n=1 Tax=Chionoecetes opilio TaxID=41210 RepID=A0A8J4YEY3_CHIOP|nr:Protein spaetzle [Chionoecetes opilio]
MAGPGGSLEGCDGWPSPVVAQVVVAAVAVALWGGGGGGGALQVAAQRSSAPVVFNDELPLLVSKTMPSCVNKTKEGDTMCEMDPEYNDEIKRLVYIFLERDRGVSNLINNPILRNLLIDVEPIARVDTRLGGVSERPICSAQETLIYPKRAKTSRDDWVFVLNQEGVQQALRVEKCISDGETCSIGMVLPGGATATCRQKYVYRRMLVLGTNKIEPEEVLMPSCCVCYTTYDDLILRTGRNRTRSQSPFAPSPPVAPASPAQPMTLAVPPQAEPTARPFKPMNVNFERVVRSHRRFIRFPHYH